MTRHFFSFLILLLLLIIIFSISFCAQLGAIGRIKANEGKLSQENIRNPMRERNHQNLCAKVVSRITIDFQPPFRHTGTVKSLAFLVVCLVATHLHPRELFLRYRFRLRRRPPEFSIFRPPDQGSFQSFPQLLESAL